MLTTTKKLSNVGLSLDKIVLLISQVENQWEIGD